MQNNNINLDKLNKENLSDQDNNISVSDNIPTDHNSTSPEDNNIIPDNTSDNTADNTTDKPIKSNPAKNGGTLISLADRTLEERREIGRKGGLKSGETKRQRKTMKDTIIDMLSDTISDDLIKEYGLEKLLNGSGKTFQDAVIGATLLGAINGDTKAIQLLRDTAGEAPVLRQEVQQEIITKEDTEMIDSLKQALIS